MPALSNPLLNVPGRPPVRAPAPLNLTALMGAAAWGRLPEAVQRRFAAGHADLTFRGVMTLRCSRIGRLFARLAKPLGGPLTRMCADDVPTTVTVRDDGRGGVIWERSFQRGGVDDARIVRSTKELGPDGGLRERTDGGLTMSLDVFEEGGWLVFQSTRFWFVLGRLRVPVPAWMGPGVCRVTHADLGNGFFRFTLSMQHPLWGETFYQAGVFADPQA